MGSGNGIATAEPVRHKKRNNFEFADMLEMLIARHLEDEKGSSYKGIGNLPFYDLKFANGDTYEIKFDSMAASTGNAAIEYYCNRRQAPTGILNTTASHWIHCIPEGNLIRCLEFEVKTLLRLCLEYPGSVVTGGDFNSSKLKLLPITELKKIALREFTISNSLIDFLRYW